MTEDADEALDALLDRVEPMSDAPSPMIEQTVECCGETLTARVTVEGNTLAVRPYRGNELAEDLRQIPPREFKDAASTDLVDVGDRFFGFRSHWAL